MLLKKDNPSAPVLISVGAGPNQAPLIREALALGYRLIGIDADSRAPGMASCHIKIQESIYEYEKIFVKISESLIEGPVAAVLSKSYGGAVKTASYLAEKYGLGLVPFARIDDFIDKSKMKEVFRKSDIPSPRSRIIDARTMKSGKAGAFPLVIKPLKGHGKAGVLLLESDADLKEYLGGLAAGSEKLIVEEYLKGDEIIAAGIVHRGKYHLADISDKVTSLPPYFVDILHISPSKYFNLAGKIAGIGQRIADAFEIVNSPLIMELLVDAEGGLHVIEAVPEFGGECIPDRLIPERTGYNFIRETIRAAADNGFTPPEPKAGRKAVVVRYITGRAGRLVSCENEGPSEIKGFIYSKVFPKIGSPVSFPATNHDRIGVVVARGGSRTAAISAAEEAVERLNIMIESGHHE